MDRIESQVSAPTSTDACSLADWAESLMFVEDRKNLSRSSLRQRARASLFFDRDDLDFHVDLLLSEVERRKKRAEAAYPFDWTETGLLRASVLDEAPYEFLLWLAVSPIYREEDRFDEIDVLFDTLVKHALIVYLGPNATGVRFGFPSSEGRPSGFPEGVSWLAKLLRLQTGSGVARPQLKDGGVDVVVWHPFQDGRSGFVVILCQCTVAKNWTPKAKDIVADIWRGWIDFGRDPLTAIAVPFAIPQTFDRWDELRRTVNIILDRMRLVELIQVNTLDDLAAIREWNDKERSMLAAST